MRNRNFAPIRNRAITLAVISLVVVPLLAIHVKAETKPPTTGSRLISDEDLLNFVWLTDPQLSPDGKRLVFTRTAVDKSNPNRTGYESSIWFLDMDSGHEAVPLTQGKHDRAPRWSPDGRSIVFVRSDLIDDAGKKRSPQLALLSIDGGEATIFTNVSDGADRPVWSPDGSRVAFLSSTVDDEAQSKGSATVNSARTSDVRIVTRPYFRSGSGNYIEPKRHTHVWIANVPSTRSDAVVEKQVTRGEFNDREQVWAPDGSKIYFLTDHSGEAFMRSSEIYAVSPTGDDPDRIAGLPMFVFDLAVSSEGKIAFHGGVAEPPRSYSKYNLWVMNPTANSQPHSLTDKYDLGMSNVVTGDLAAPGSGRAIHWSSDGRWLYDVAAGEGSTILIRVDSSSGALTEISPRKQSVLDFSVTADGRRIVALVSSPTMVGDLFNVTSDGAEHRLTDVNQKLWSQLRLTEPEEIRYKSFDKKDIQGWIQKPPDFDPQKKYPLILNIHGGPHGSWGWIFSHEDQWMAAQGYVVVYINPRGSNGYGQEFGDGIHYRFPGDDFRDLMLGVDHVLHLGYIDEKKLCITGGSAGGLLTDWTVTHTDRFVAAVSQRDISDQGAWWYTTDLPWFRPSFVDFKVPPFEDPADYAARSPITFVENVHTPTMFLFGENDHLAIPSAGAEPMFRALKFLHRPSVMVIFPREGHGVGEPWHRVERLRHIMGWFDTWTRGVPHPEYEIDVNRESY